MKYYVTIYIDPLIECFMDFKEKCFINIEDATHAFLGLTHTPPDELDKIDNEIKMQKLKNTDWKDIDKRWYESLEINEYNDGFWGFGTGTDSVYNTAGKVFKNNQYVMDNNVKTNTYEIKKLRSEQTFKNRCTLEVSQEQYEKLLQEIKNDYEATKTITPRSEVGISGDLTYNVLNNNCVTWVLNKLDSIGIEIIDNEEWLPDNISIRDSLLMKFPYLKFYNTTFLKFQNIDSNLESIKGAKAFRTWARSMIENNYMCYVDESTLEKEVQVFCKRDTDNQKLYESIKRFYKTQAQLKSVYEKLGTLLDKLLQKIDDENVQGDFELIYFDKQDKKIKILKAQNNYEPMKIAELDAMIPANNYVLSKFYPFVFIPKDTIAERILYHEYDYGKVSQGYQKDRNEFYYNILAGIQSDKYWSSSYHKLTKAYKQFQAKEVENV
ncbi:hypothetical protein [Campylobacter coli]|uniref:hypothetical protein n=1 Tax=Campylobacter coli TaxID=195 RepID=UPI0007174815|nr:hypothetical protein [Campylobacter coli]KRS46710.1 hypothetical protein DB18_09505 [Campylobacter coli]